MARQLEDFVRSMVMHLPSLKGLLAQHIAYNGNILPHVYFGDITRHVVLLFHMRGGADLVPRRELRDILLYLEEVYSAGGDEVQELISVSFLENLPRPDEEGGPVRTLLGTNLREQLAAIG